jgi:hypothetical protein
MKRSLLVAGVAIISLVVAAPAAAASHGRSADAHIAKKCKKKHGKKKCKKPAPAPVPAPVVTPPAPTPAPLTDAEVITRVSQKAAEYCDVDPDCIEGGYYYVDPNPSEASCSSKSTYSWTCYGWNDEDADFDPPNATCDFREVVERVGINGITSHQDLGFADGGWDCFGM